jgi:hypothetical protein
MNASRGVCGSRRSVHTSACAILCARKNGAKSARYSGAGAPRMYQPNVVSRYIGLRIPIPAYQYQASAYTKKMKKEWDVLVALRIIDRISQYCPKPQAYRHCRHPFLVTTIVVIVITSVVFLPGILLVLTIRRHSTRALRRAINIGAIERIIERMQRDQRKCECTVCILARTSIKDSPVMQ